MWAVRGMPWPGLREALDKDQVLQTLAETPLMLDVMSLAYRDIPAGAFTSDAFATQVLDTEETRRSKLFDTYIAKMVKRKGKSAQQFTR